MRFNDKELAHWASSFVPDREGMMDKKGANKGQGIKPSLSLSLSLSHTPLHAHTHTHTHTYARSCTRTHAHTHTHIHTHAQYACTIFAHTTGYKQRWFRLKGNLLFYYKLDEYGGWQVRMSAYRCRNVFGAESLV